MPNSWPYNSNNWKNLRRLKLESVGYECEQEGCKSKRRLHVHHREPLTKEQRGSRDERAGFPSLDNLEVLCLNHHAILHGLLIRGLDPVEVQEWDVFTGELEYVEQS